MKTLLMLAVLFFTVTSAALALIGDDMQQIETRYGKPMQVVAEHGAHREIGYGAHDFMIVVDFVDGVSQRETFARPDKSTLSAEAVQQLLALSAAEGQTWRGLPPKGDDRFWGRSDGKALAGFPAQRNFLFVMDVHYAPHK